MPLSDFLAQVPKAPPAETILSLEFVVSRGILFNYLIAHVRWPLHGLFLDLQTYLQTVYAGRVNTQQEAVKRLVETYAKGREYAALSLYTELTFTHAPSQIAMGCFRLAAQEHAFVDEFDKYLSFRINWMPAEKLVDLHAKLGEVEAAVTARRGWTPPLAEGKRIDLKLQGCRNPEFLPDSALWVSVYNLSHAKRKRQRDEEKERKRAKKARREADLFEGVQGVFD
ncbi:hypothetical protein HK405_011756 [Cladochytrium tenue]|nr:hypothetical protein HK405_011756 [Cladochytrium tenue]